MNDPRISRLTRRRLVGTAAAGAAAASVFASVPNIIWAQETTEVHMIHPTVNEAWDKQLEAVVNAFMAANPTIKVNLEHRPGDQYWDKLQTEYAGGQAADVTSIQMDWTVPGASRGMFVDLNPFIERDQVDQSDLWYDMTREWAWEGGMYGGILYAGGQNLYVNKGLLEAAGVAWPTVDWTWDDLLAAAQACTDEANQQYGIHFDLVQPPYWSSSFIHGAGGTVLNDAKDECTLNSAEARAGLQWIVDLMHVHKVMPTPSATEGQDNPFLTGKIAFMFGGGWQEQGIRATEIDWDFAPMPLHPTTGTKSVQIGSNAWSIMSTTDHEDASWELVKYLSSPEGSRGMMSLGIPGYTSIIESAEFKEIHAPQDIGVPVADFQSSGHDYYPTPDANEWWGAVEAELGPMWTGEDDVENSTQRAVDRVNEIFSQRGTF
jgi:multiple sugar transport system substrate-binding protein